MFGLSAEQILRFSEFSAAIFGESCRFLLKRHNKAGDGLRIDFLFSSVVSLPFAFCIIILRLSFAVFCHRGSHLGAVHPSSISLCHFDYFKLPQKGIPHPSFLGIGAVCRKAPRIDVQIHLR
jgi:hypothetical protein